MSSTLVKSFAQHAGRNPFSGTPEEQKEYKELAEALNKQARDEWDNPEFHRQVAADLSQTLDWGFSQGAFFQNYFATEMLGEFDRSVVRNRRGMKAFWTARGGAINESYITTDIYEIQRDTIGFKVSEHEDRLRANFAESIADIAALGGERLVAEVHRRFFGLLQAAIPSNSPYYATTATLSSTVLNPLISAVKDSIRPDGVGPVPVSIVGRAAAVDQISDFDGFAPEAQEEIRKQGRLGVYRGCNIVALEHFVDEDNLPYIPAGELWITGANVGKFAKFGDLRTRTWDDPDTGYQFYKGSAAAGAIVARPEVARRVVISSITD